LLLSLTFIFSVIFYFGAPWELPAYLKDIGSPTNYKLNVPEIYGLLHLVTREDGYQLGSDIDPNEKLALDVYAKGEKKVDWVKEMERLDELYPVIVFSKTYCPYSKMGKALIATYNLKPEPKIIEVDLRADQHIIKTLSIRLTGRGTVPNVILKGKTIGGSDDIHALHNAGTLKATFEKVGVKSREIVRI